ncbi:YdeI/OmpD-associated family protein [Collimonas pratensis]|uniref:Bacteriocin-protection, YdeI/OmpD-Associated family protein n=1 Tax=Collimonas pratensis TaxID=279113 RepID=A0ABM5Z7J1_9BURK|nr:YdeI/OmpD-associated family protein [Collimonas pratensis]AMP15199.1 bacteriocin-protection, YdeI/OmpD-Associated family protein [Collimonas pratensis]
MSVERKPAEAASILQFDDKKAWAAWLKKHHGKSSGVWLRFAKKGAESSSATHPEALELALCYGWIDGQKKSDDAQFWLQRFTPRSARSIWSKINRDKALALIASGQMQVAGLLEVERAKDDGRWQAAYDSARTAAIPEDLQQALAANAAAQAFFATLDAQNRYAVLFRIQTAKKAETRAKRIAAFTQMLGEHKKLHP